MTEEAEYNIENIHELEKRLNEINVPKDSYSILKGGLPNDVCCIVKTDDSWEVYYSERGKKFRLKTFSKEGEACEYFFDMVEKGTRGYR